MSDTISMTSIFQVDGALQTAISEISSTGVIAGSTYSTADGSSGEQGFVSTNGVTQFISLPGSFDVHVTGVNALGYVIGYANLPNFTDVGFAGTSSNLMVFDSPAYASLIPFAETDAGEVFLNGPVSTPGVSPEYTLQGGVITPLIVAVPGASSTVVQAVSPAGNVIAGSAIIKGQVFGFTDNDGILSTFLIPGSHPSVSVYAVNNQGEAGGEIIPGDDTEPGMYVNEGFIYNDGKLELPFSRSAESSSTIFGVNDKGDVVGSQSIGAVTTSYVFTPDGVAHEVIVPGDYALTVVTGINDAGQVYGDAISPVGPNGGEPAEVGVIGEIPCFAAGTMISVPNGRVAVETLAVGDEVLTVSGEARKIVWTGHRTIDLRRHAAPEVVRPVCILAGAFGLAQPDRDLMLSPDHNLYVDGVLIPAKCLVNDLNVVELDFATVTYHHIELATHDVVIANNLPAETYLDTGNRANFAGEKAMIAHPDFSSAPDLNYFAWISGGYAPLILVGAELNKVRARLGVQARVSMSDALVA